MNRVSEPSETLQAVLAEVPLEYRERFAHVAEGELESVAALRESIRAYQGMVRKVAAWVTALDPDVADTIAASCLGLLDRFGSGPHARIVVAASTYFIEEDEDDEVTGVLGFDDDIQVVNAVCRVLEAPELLVPLIR